MSSESFQDEAREELAEDREYVMDWIIKMTDEGNAHFCDSLAAALTTNDIEPIRALLEQHIEADEEAVATRAERLFQAHCESMEDDEPDLPPPITGHDSDIALDLYERSHGW